MKPKLSVVRPEVKWFQPDPAEVKAAEGKAYIALLCEKAKNQMAIERLTRTSNLTTAPKYRPCPCKCGMTLLWSNPGGHIVPAELIADWQADAQDEQDERLEDADIEAVMKAPVEVPLKPAVSQAQVLWARDMVAQYPKKSREQISRENGGISWAQLEHYAKTPLAGLPERKGRKAPVEKPASQAKPRASKAKPTTKKVKEG